MYLFYSSEQSIGGSDDEGIPLTQEELRQRAMQGVSVHSHYVSWESIYKDLNTCLW